MRTTPEGLEHRSIVDALGEAWHFDVAEAEYAAVGAGSYHWEAVDTSGDRRFVTVDDLDQKAWLGTTREATFEGLRRAFDTAVALHDGGLPFVVAPIPSHLGDSVRRLDSRYTIALFPFVEGEAGQFGWIVDEAERRSVVEMVAEVHQATAAVGPGVRSVGLDLPGRLQLEAALLELDEPWSGGPLSEPARQAVKDAAPELAELLALADRLAAEAAQRGRDWVVTHGEPHAANVMRTAAGRVLVDWDTVALAPPERDLWMLVAGGADAADLYVRSTGTRLDDTALDFFRLAWDLGDLAEYLNVLRSPHQEDDDSAWGLQAIRNCTAVRKSWAALLE